MQKRYNKYMSILEVKNLSKKYENNVQALDDVSFKANDKELLVILGTSGSGKTTLLRILAGLEENYSGEVILDNDNVNEISFKDRGVAMVFQSYALYPQLTTLQNITLPLKQKLFYLPVLDKKGNQILGINHDKIEELKKKISNLEKDENYKANKKALKTEIKALKKIKDTPIYKYQSLSNEVIEQRVNEVVEFLELSSILSQRASTLSGGQKQRVALAKAMLREPSLLLLDEPLSNLDLKLKKNARELIYKVHQKCGCTTVLVTHDQNDAFTLADRVIILQDGHIEQIGTKEEIYKTPNNVFVSQFFGIPPMNLFECKVENGNVITNTGETIANLDKLESVIVGIRGEDILISENGEYSATVIKCELAGRNYMVHLKLFGVETLLKSETKFEPDTKVNVNISKENIVFFDSNTKKRIC